jgi:hypothetical protein
MKPWKLIFSRLLTVRYRIWCLVALAAIPTQAALANDLALGQTAKVTKLSIPIVPPTDFNFKGRATLYAMRQAQVMKYPELLTAQYVPDGECFGQIEDQRPWWGTYGLSYYGSGKNSIKGPSLESRFFLNPFLLAGDRSGLGLPKDKISEADLAKKSYPTYLQPSDLQWSPKVKKGEVTYDITGYQKQMCSLLGYDKYELHGPRDISLINARDLGLKFVYIPPSWSLNVKIGSPMKGVMRIPQFIHKGDSCGYPGGCNNQSPETPWLQSFTIEKLPARIGFLFWKKPPITRKVPPDMMFFVLYK